MLTLQYLCIKSNGFLLPLPLLNMAAMFSDSKRLLLAVVLLLAIAQASMETDNEIKEVPKIAAPAPLVGAAAPPVRAPAPPTGAPAPLINCKAGCGERCKLHSRPNLCMRACGTCCARCKCVPPGQSGNREVCGSCYTDWKTHNNQTKCP